MLKYIEGDLLKSEETFIIHGCNCWKVMGSGIAAQIRTKYPQAADADMNTAWGDRDKLGTYSSATGFTDGGLKRIIINAYTQFDFGTDKRNVDYEAIKEVFTKLCKDYPEIETFAMPKIGAGLARGDWPTIEKILDTVSANYRKTFHIYILPNA